MLHFRAAVLAALSLGLMACGEKAQVPLVVGSASGLALPPARESLIPTVNIAPARGWQGRGKPQAAPGLTVKAFADGLDHPRWLYVLPNGDVLVAETNAPPQAEPAGGLKARVQGYLMKRAGAAVPSANRITLLRDSDHDGVADQRHVFLANLNSPLGMALVDGGLYVANTDALLRYPYRDGDTAIEGQSTRLAELPAGPRNYHWTRNLVASPDGKRLYVAVGSDSNIAEHGIEAERDRAAILEIDIATGQRRVYASGLRNPVGMAWQPDTGALWTAVNERDELSSDLGPDYLTSVYDDAFYGWPYSYYGRNVDDRVWPQRPEKVAEARVPDYALGAHTASLGLAYSRGTSLPATYSEGMFVGQHGSWNRRPHSGYKVIFVPFRDGMPSGEPLDVLSGFLSAEGEALGRPVGVAVDTRGALLVADDVGNVVWRVSAQAPSPAGDAAAAGAAGESEVARAVREVGALVQAASGEGENDSRGGCADRRAEELDSLDEDSGDALGLYVSDHFVYARDALAAVSNPSITTTTTTTTR